MFPAEADKQANNCAGKVCPMELENWVQTSHSKPGSATGSHPIQREGGWTGGRGHIGDRASQLGGPVDWLEGPVDSLIIFCTIQFSRRWMKTEEVVAVMTIRMILKSFRKIMFPPFDWEPKQSAKCITFALNMHSP